jgi:hypothetical protein
VFHCREYDAEELVESVTRWAPDLACTQVVGLRHGTRLAAWESRHGSLVAAQLATPAEQWPTGLAELVASVRTDDFALTEGNVDDSLDLVVVLRQSA